MATIVHASITIHASVGMNTSFAKFFSKFGRLSGNQFRKKFLEILVQIWGASEFHFFSRNLPLLHWRSYLLTYGSYLLNSCGSRDLLAIFGGSDGGRSACAARAPGYMLGCPADCVSIASTVVPMAHRPRRRSLVIMASMIYGINNGFLGVHTITASFAM